VLPQGDIVGRVPQRFAQRGQRIGTRHGGLAQGRKRA
jgi:hypothetical protein